MGANEKTNWLLHLYISGETPQVRRAVALLEEVCKEHFKGPGKIKVINVRQDPLAGVEENIIATPTLVKKLPEPVLRIIGDLSDIGKLILALDLMNDE